MAKSVCPDAILVILSNPTPESSSDRNLLFNFSISRLLERDTHKFLKFSISLLCFRYWQPISRLLATDTHKFLKFLIGLGNFEINNKLQLTKDLLASYGKNKKKTIEEGR